MVETNTSPEPNHRRWQFTLAQLFSLVTGVCLLCATISAVVQLSATHSLIWALIARLLGVATVGILIGALIADTGKALIGAVTGMIIADLAYTVGLFFDWHQGALVLSLKGFLLNPLLFVCVFPGAMAGVKNRLIGILVGIVPVQAMACTVIGVGLFTLFTNPPMNEGPGMIIGFVLLLLPPATFLSTIGWFGARVAIHATGRLSNVTTLWGTSLLFLLIAVSSYALPAASEADSILRLLVVGLAEGCSLGFAVAAICWGRRPER